MGLDYNLYAIGMSIGSNILINYLGTYQTNLKAALTLNNPWDVNLCINMMRKSVVEKFLTMSLSEAFLLRKGLNFTQNFRQFKEDKKQLELEVENSKFGISKKEDMIFDGIIDRFQLNVDSIEKSMNWSEFDVNYTNKISVNDMSNYSKDLSHSVIEYYNKSSCLH